MVKDNFVIGVKTTDKTSAEPVTLAEAKQWCKVELAITEENTIITELITSARQLCEGYSCISFTPKTVIAILNNSGGGVELPYGPVKDSPEITYFDSTAVAITDIILQGDEFKYIESPCYDFIKATYETGYTTLPLNFKTALLQQIVYSYENRGDATIQGLSPMVKQSLKPYRRIW
mgnify:CR=1 FL=1